MTDNFQDRLRGIRDTKKKESQSQSLVREDDARRKSELTALSLRAREHVQEIIEEHARQFLVEIPRFSVSKGFYESKYSFSLSDDELRVDSKSEMDKYFSRITFLLNPIATKSTFEITSKLTVRNRDIESNSIKKPMDESGIDEAEFRAFISGEFLRFADTYFTDDGTSPVEIPDLQSSESEYGEAGAKDSSDGDSSHESLKNLEDSKGSRGSQDSSKGGGGTGSN